MTTGGFSTAGTGFTARIITNPDADIAQDRTVTTAGAYTATAPLSGSAAWLMQIATFKAATTTGGDTTAPTVAITSPPGTVSGTVTVTADATDNVGVAGVRFFVDGNHAGRRGHRRALRAAWDTRTVTNGAHTLTAQARDVDGNTHIGAGHGHRQQRRRTATNSRTRCWPPASTCRRDEVPAGRPHARRRARRDDQGPAAALHAAPTRRRSCSSPTSARPACSRASTTSPSTRTSPPTTTTTSSTPLGRRTTTGCPASPPTPTLTGTVAGSELVIYQDPQNANAEHHGGAIMFGNDGKLYFTTGEHFNAAVAQDLTNPRGKILRINTDGTVPTDNPFYDGAGPQLGRRSGPSGCAIRTAPTTTRPPGGCSSATSAATSTRPRTRRSTSAARRQLRLAQLSKAPAAIRPTPARIYSYPHNGRDAADHRRVRLPRRPVPQQLPGQLLLRRLRPELDQAPDLRRQRQRHRRVQLRARQRRGRRALRRHRLPDRGPRRARSTTSTSATPTSAARSA